MCNVTWQGQSKNEQYLSHYKAHNEDFYIHGMDHCHRLLKKKDVACKNILARNIISTENKTASQNSTGTILLCIIKEIKKYP